MTYRNFISKVLLTAFLLQSALTSVAAAQDFSPDPDWKISAYLWMTSLDGTLGIGPIEADIDVGFSDLLSSLDIGGALAVRRDWGANMLVGDLTYISLSPDAQPGPAGSSISSSLDLTLFNTYYGRKWGRDDRYGALLVGARYMKMDLGMSAAFDLPGEPVVEMNGSPSFTDFLIGGMFGTELSSKWAMFVQGDVGAGGSNNSWNAQIMFQRKLKSGNRIDMGARILSVDFDDTLASGDLFVLDATMTGLMFGFTWD
jgi:hypothetical protein